MAEKQDLTEKYEREEKFCKYWHSVFCLFYFKTVFSFDEFQDDKVATGRKSLIGSSEHVWYICSGFQRQFC